MPRSMICISAATLIGVAATAQPGTPPGADPDWRAAEAGWLTGHVRLTSPDDYVKAGEAYFSHDGRRVIFQAVPVPPEGEAPSPHYSMYIADLVTDDDGAPTGLANARRISPEGSANTCGWFHPKDADRVLFGSTLVPPSADDQPGYQRGTGRYTWQFPIEMEVVELDLGAGDAEPRAIFTRPGYTAEGSWSPDGRHILYAQVDPEKSRELGRPDADLYVYDTTTGEHTTLVVAEGYDGGPFFSPDGRWICYRSDRRGDNLLQLFIAELAFEDPSDRRRITGIRREAQVTDNQHVNWAPYWDPTGSYLVYATSEVGHFNYEVFGVSVDALTSGGFGRGGEAKPVRITSAGGFDGLPVFRPTSSHLMWTAQRALPGDTEKTPSSQLWIAEVDLRAMRRGVVGEAEAPN